ncbi:MAG TPA: acyl carrier protein [Bacillota bacterium]|nr:acyl carrier protein [Bacillota bacterium]HOK69043.1 acyl carrier protein [Bacillota bacterium]HPP84601.1 acyl carrier protein [Bacillota bacterium]
MFEKLKNVLVEEMSINPDDITPDAELINDLGFNSLELADLIVLCEEKFDVVFDEKDLPSLVTVGDVANYIELNS